MTLNWSEDLCEKTQTTIFGSELHFFDDHLKSLSKPSDRNFFKNASKSLQQAQKLDILKKTQGEKTENSRKKLNNTRKKIKVSANFAE